MNYEEVVVCEVQELLNILWFILLGLFRFFESRGYILGF